MQQALVWIKIQYLYNNAVHKNSDVLFICLPGEGSEVAHFRWACKQLHHLAKWDARVNTPVPRWAVPGR